MYITSLQIVMILITIMIIVILKLETCARGVYYISEYSVDSHNDNDNGKNGHYTAHRTVVRSVSSC